MDTYAYRDQLSIDTPEQVDLRLPLAGLGSRFFAAFLDILLQIAAYLTIFLVLAVLIAMTSLRHRTDNLSDRGALWLGAAYILLNFLFFWGYYTLFEAFWHGQTPGKRAANIRVVKDSGREITLFESMTRNLLRLIDLMPGFYAVGVITILVSKQNKRLGDLLAGTLVLHRESGAPAQRAAHESRTFTAGIYAEPFSAALQHDPQQAFGIVFAAEAVAHLQPDDLVMLESFFARVVDLDTGTTDRLSAQLLAGLCSRMHVEVPAQPPARRCLEAVAWQLRSLGTFR